MNEIILVPIKDFSQAKARLSGLLDKSTRELLAIALADLVCSQSTRSPIRVVCESPTVASWARSKHLMVSKNPGIGLNQSVQLAANAARLEGYSRISVIHSDLPLAQNLDLITSGVDPAQAVIIPDRLGDGTNLLSLPANSLAGLSRVDGFCFQYGPRSFQNHLGQAKALNLDPVVIDPSPLGLDIDTASDWNELVSLQSLVTSAELNKIINNYKDQVKSALGTL